MSVLLNALTDQFREHAGELPGTRRPQVVEVREQAFSRFEAAGMPTIKLEDWKYTDIRTLRDAEYIALGRQRGHTDTAPGALTLSELSLPEFTPHVVVFLNGEFCSRLSTLDSLPAGVKFTTIESLLQHGSVEILEHMSRHDAAFPSLNSAFLADGVIIDLAPETVLEDPIHVIFVNARTLAPQLNTARLIINGRRNSSATIVESHCGLPGAQGMTNALTEIEVNDGASLSHYRVQIDQPATHHIGSVFVTVGQDAAVATYSFAFGGAITRIDVNADLVGPGASTVVNGLFMAGENQHIDHHTRIRHQVGRTRSTENYKGIADGNGRGVFNGKIIVAKDAQKIEATQSSRNLLLSEGAEIDTKPELEIYADDVKCAHGATVGQLDEDALFYLRTRGIDERSARSILTVAFAADIADGVDIAPLRQWLEQIITARTSDGGVNEIENRD